MKFVHCSPWLTAIIGSRLAVAGAPVSREADPSGVGTSISCPSRWDVCQHALKVFLGLQELCLAGVPRGLEIATAQPIRTFQVDQPSSPLIDGERTITTSYIMDNDNYP